MLGDGRVWVEGLADGEVGAVVVDCEVAIVSDCGQRRSLQCKKQGGVRCL